MIKLLLIFWVGISAAGFPEFLEQDTTDQNHGYLCLGYSLDLLNNSSLAGYDTKLVYIPRSKKYPEGHYVIGIYDKGWKLFEPQNDKPFTSSNVAVVLTGFDVLNETSVIKRGTVPIVLQGTKYVVAEI